MHPTPSGLTPRRPLVPLQCHLQVYAHMDVVPVDKLSWSVDPFAGIIKDGFVWGRGAIDDKQAVLGHLEAVEDLLASGVTPTRDLFIAFGHDEETSGEEGAREIARLLAAQGHRFEFLLDEGLFIIADAVRLGRLINVGHILRSSRAEATRKQWI